MSGYKSRSHTLSQTRGTCPRVEKTTMFQNPIHPALHTDRPDSTLRPLLGVMTVPQVLTIWLGHRAAGVSLVSWSAYLASALMWFWYGIQKRDKNIYLPCV